MMSADTSSAGVQKETPCQGKFGGTSYLPAHQKKPPNKQLLVAPGIATSSKRLLDAY